MRGSKSWNMLLKRSEESTMCFLITRIDFSSQNSLLGSKIIEQNEQIDGVLRVLQLQEAQLTTAGEFFNKLVADLQTRDRMIDEENNTLRAKVLFSSKGV